MTAGMPSSRASTAAWLSGPPVGRDDARRRSPAPCCRPASCTATTRMSPGSIASSASSGRVRPTGRAAVARSLPMPEPCRPSPSARSPPMPSCSITSCTVVDELGQRPAGRTVERWCRLGRCRASSAESSAASSGADRRARGELVRARRARRTAPGSTSSAGRARTRAPGRSAEAAIDEAPAELEQREPQQAERPLGRRRARCRRAGSSPPAPRSGRSSNSADRPRAPSARTCAVRAADVIARLSRTSLAMIVASTASGTSPSVTPSMS